MGKRPPTPPVILAVDDDPGLLASLHLILDDSYDVLDAPDAVSGLAAIAAGHIDLVLLDLVMDGLDGVGFLEELRSIQRRVPVIVLSALRDPDVVATVMRLGAADYIVKPFDEDRLLTTVASALGPTAICPAPQRPQLAIVNCAAVLAASVAVLLAGAVDVEILGTASDFLVYLESCRPDLVIVDASSVDRSADLVRVIDDSCRGQTVILLGGPAAPPRGPAGSSYMTLRHPVAVRPLLRGIADSLPQHASSRLRISDLSLRMVDYLATHLAGTDIRDLGGVLGRSSYNLSRIFRNETGMSAKRFVNRFRVEVARALLRTTDQKVESIAALVGLHDASHLSRLFQQHIGLRPSDIRRSDGGTRASDPLDSGRT